MSRNTWPEEARFQPIGSGWAAVINTQRPTRAQSGNEARGIRNTPSIKVTFGQSERPTLLPRKPLCKGLLRGLNAEADVEYVAVPDDVVLAFDAEEILGFGFA